MHDKFFAAEIDTSIASIDLHRSLTLSDALDQLEKELFFLSQHGERYCTVIHGIGTGRLAAAVHERLEKHPLVVGWQESEQGGRCLVLF